MQAKKPKITVTVVNADVGGFIGHISSHPDVLDTAKERLHNAKEKGAIIDFHVLRCGDDLGFVMTHANGLKDASIHDLAWNTLEACTDSAKELKLYKAGEDTSIGAAQMTHGGKGPAVAEIEFLERASEPVLIFMANKTATGAWSLPMYKIFADPFNTVGLVIDPTMHEGFSFKVLDVKENKEITLSAPNELYSLLALIGITSRYVVTSVYRNSDAQEAAAIAVRKLNSGDGGHISRDNPIAVVRCQAGFPAVGEALEAFAMPHLVRGWMREIHNGPLMPVPFYEANPSRFDGPPRLIGAGFQLSNGKLIGPHDMFDDPSFDETRRTANRVTEYMRRHGPFQPHRLYSEDIEHALPELIDKLKDRFHP